MIPPACTRPAYDIDASWWDRVTYTAIAPLLDLGFERPLEHVDLYALRPEQQADVIADKVTNLMSSAEVDADDSDSDDRGLISRVCTCHALPFCCVRRVPRVVKAVLVLMRPYWLYAGKARFCSELIAILNPLVLAELMRAIGAGDSISYLYLLAFLFLVFALLSAFLLQQHHDNVCRACLVVRSGLTSALYAKSMRLTPTARAEIGTGSITTMMSVDAQRIGEALLFMHNVWSCPMQILVSLALLLNFIGPAALGGAFLAGMVLFIEGLLAKLSLRLNRAVLSATDARMQCMSQTVKNIRSIKAYGWQSAFLQRILQSRAVEVSRLRIVALVRAVIVMLLQATPVLVSLCTFTIYTYSNDVPITPIQAFTSLSLFALLRAPLTIMPKVISTLVDSIASFDRLDRFMRASELAPRKATESCPGMINVSRVDVYFDFDTSSASKPFIRNFDFHCAPGSFTVCVGPIASGKSSLLMALLSELDARSTGAASEFSVFGSIAYVAQQTWIPNSTVRNAICFGLAFDTEWYNRVLFACALQTDIESFSAGDLTEIGERGLNLSGGQKMRIALARAVYSRADIYLLDAPLSALDVHVGQHVLERCICTLLRGRTVVLVTHQLEAAQFADQIIVMNCADSSADSVACVAERGTFAKLMSSDSIFRQMYSEQMSQQNGTQSPSALKVESIDRRTPVAIDASLRMFADGSISFDLNHSALLVPANSASLEMRDDGSISSSPDKRPDQNSAVLSIDNELTETAQLAAGALIVAETRFKGENTSETYLGYLQACGKEYVALIILLIVSVRMLDVFNDLWLSVWSSAAKGSNSFVSQLAANFFSSIRPPAGASSSEYLVIYAYFGLSSVALLMLVSALTAQIGLSGSSALHDKMVSSLLRSPMSFFDTTPVGRILNRCSRDMESLDQSLTVQLLDMGLLGAMLLVNLLAVCIISPLFLICLAPVTALFWRIQTKYRRSSRELKRLDSLSRSPIFADFAEMLDGVETVRAFSAQNRMRQLNFSRINRFGEAWVCLMGINRWLGIRLDVLASLILCSIALVAIHSRASLSSALIGMLVGYGVTMTGNLNRLVRTALDAEQDFSSVERLLEYTKLPPEDGSSTVENQSENVRFGSVGAIEFQSVSARYRPGLDLVVKDLSFSLRPCEKLGICGRTGAGKSSLLSLLFRLLGCSSGRILIDGVNIASIPLETLRQSLSIVPQEPILFDGTLRFNLDPRGMFADDRIWSALDRARLADTVRRLPGQLEAQICESGSSFSAGERQLLCMARALLSPARILVLDEATSSVDFATDAAIQHMIRSEFQDRTVLTIAHRLQTITWMDRVLVLDRGQIVEFDTPSNLQSQNGIFSAMLNELN